jgi:hypothetical protein
MINKILNLTKQLYPTGRAFSIHEGSKIERLHRALAVSENIAFNDSLSILNSILPDNDAFTLDDCARWEQRLGLITNTNVLFSDRKLAIIRKMNHPGTILARQSRDYIQDQLQLAGFNVFVHENTYGLPPESILILPLELGEMGDPEMGEIEMGDAESYFPDLFIYPEMGEIEMGDPEMGETVYNNIIVNSINVLFDEFFDIGQNNFSTFFIGGEILGTFANVDSERMDEFRQLILKIKPVQTVGILFINYI